MILLSCNVCGACSHLAGTAHRGRSLLRYDLASESEGLGQLGQGRASGGSTHFCCNSTISFLELL